MKPLLSVISYNRKAETLATLRALEATGALEAAVCFYVDNASVDGTYEAVEQVVFDEDWPVMCVQNKTNVGCPRALNQVLELRDAGQHFIKVDNDVELQTVGWVEGLCRLMDEHPEIALASPWYEELATANQGRLIRDHGDWMEYFPIVGHCVIHAGWLLDQVGYFDVLADDHLYGFEDLLMAHRAAAIGALCVVDRRLTLRNIQRKNSLDSSGHEGERRAQHIDRLRPLYDERRRMIHFLKGDYYVTRDGQWNDHQCHDPEIEIPERHS